jgi:threonine dehydrogenase-like Zn-dependent dehydrogenase
MVYSGRIHGVPHEPHVTNYTTNLMFMQPHDYSLRRSLSPGASFLSVWLSDTGGTPHNGRALSRCKEKTVRVAIIGAGPVGLTAAIGAEQSGLTPIVFERAEGKTAIRVSVWLRVPN